MTAALMAVTIVNMARLALRFDLRPLGVDGSLLGLEFALLHFIAQLTLVGDVALGQFSHGAHGQPHQRTVFDPREPLGLGTDCDGGRAAHFGQGGEGEISECRVVGAGHRNATGANQVGALSTDLSDTLTLEDLIETLGVNYLAFRTVERFAVLDAVAILIFRVEHLKPPVVQVVH